MDFFQYAIIGVFSAFFIIVLIVVIIQRTNQCCRQQIIDDEYQQVEPTTNTTETIIQIDPVQQQIEKYTRTYVLDESRDEECSICLDPFEKEDVIRILICTHRYHQKCMDDWFYRTNVLNCPQCDISIDTDPHI